MNSQEDPQPEVQISKPTLGETMKFKIYGLFDWFKSIRTKLIRKLGGVPIEKGYTYDEAKAEMDLVWPDTEDEMQNMVKDDVLELLGVFGSQGHSGMSAPYVVNVFKTLALHKPLTPLSGEDDEWCELDYTVDMKAQNKRLSSVFKRSDGTAYRSDGKVFIEPDGAAFTSSDSRVEIEFPYTPEREYVYLDEEENVIDRKVVEE